VNDLSGSLLALNVGKIATLRHGSKKISSAFVKQPVLHPVYMRRLGLDGDEQAYEGHGGPDRAVLVYSRGNYAHWKRELNLDLPDSAAFGENFTVDGLTEKQVHIGDVFEVGDAIVQVAQARPPCFKIGARYGVPRMSLLVQQVGFTGYLLRVLQNGFVASGQRVTLVSRQSHGISVAEANRIMNVERRDLDGARRLLEVPDLAQVMRKDLEHRLKVKGLGEDVERLYGA
jgi:MOSC domain-containing protein YiiM